MVYAPMDDPQIAVYMYVEKAGGGGFLGDATRSVPDAYFAQKDVVDTVRSENTLNWRQRKAAKKKREKTMTQVNAKHNPRRSAVWIAAAVFAAMTCALTAAFPIPMFNGYFNLGDTIVLLGAFPARRLTASPPPDGSGCADLLLGYTVYAPATLVIKALVALTSGAIYRRLPKRLPGLLLAAVAGELVMCAGYFAFECCGLVHRRRRARACSRRICRRPASTPQSRRCPAGAAPQPPAGRSGRGFKSCRRSVNRQNARAELLCEQAKLRAGELVVVGCSTSEICGSRIGKGFSARGGRGGRVPRDL